MLNSEKNILPNIVAATKHYKDKALELHSKILNHQALHEKLKFIDQANQVKLKI